MTGGGGEEQEDQQRQGQEPRMARHHITHCHPAADYDCSRRRHDQLIITWTRASPQQLLLHELLKHSTIRTFYFQTRFVVSYTYRRGFKWRLNRHKQYHRSNNLTWSTLQNNECHFNERYFPQKIIEECAIRMFWVLWLKLALFDTQSEFLLSALTSPVCLFYTLKGTTKFLRSRVRFSTVYLYRICWV